MSAGTDAGPLAVAARRLAGGTRGPGEAEAGTGAGAGTDIDTSTNTSRGTGTGAVAAPPADGRPGQAGAATVPDRSGAVTSIPPGTEAVDGVPAAGGHPQPAAPGRGVWTAGREHGFTAARLGVWLLVLCGPAALLLALSSRGPAVAPAPAPVAAAADLAVLAAAESAALRWAGDAGVRAAAVSATGPASGPGTGPTEGAAWSVLVEVVLAGTDEDGGPTTTTTHLQVPVTTGEDGAVTPLGDPAVVAGPPADGAGAPPLDGTTLEPSDARAQSAAAFVTALVTGADVTPLTAPGSALRTTDPPAASAVSTGEVTLLPTADGTAAATATTARVAIAALLDPPSGVPGDDPRPATYYLSLAERDGRWEVTALDPTPVQQPTPPEEQP